MPNSYLLAAYLVFWLAPFALLVSMWRRQRRLEREIALLQERLDAREPQRPGVRET